MDDSSSRFVNELKDILGDEAAVMTAYPDEIADVARDVRAIVLTMNAGDLGQARQAAEAANAAVEINPGVRLLLGINDVDDDNREIDQIPAARTTLCALAKHLSAKAFWRFDLEHQAVILVASGFGHRVGAKLHVPFHLVRAP